MVESHNVFIDDAKELMLTALNYKEFIKMPIVRDIRYKREMIFNGEIATKILMKDEVSEVGFKRCYIGDNEGD
jgi:hypothetical protein